MKMSNITRTNSLHGLLVGCFLLLSGCLTAAVGVVAVSTIEVAKDQRSVGKLIDDNIIEANIYKDIVTDPSLDDGAHISTTVVNGIVLLTGEVATSQQKQHAEKIANSYQGVDQVVNQLAILGVSSLTARTNDSLITAKVKTELIRSNEVDASTVKVVTERGVVYLMGVVTPTQGAAAVSLAKQVGGVQRIVKIFMATAQ